MSTFETVIYYAGVMKFLLSDVREKGLKVSPLVLFSRIRSVLPQEMQSVLIELLEIFISMEQVLGMIPVMKPYKRLLPLFYYLSGTETLYYTTEDRLLPMHKKLLKRPAPLFLRTVQVEVGPRVYTEEQIFEEVEYTDQQEKLFEIGKLEQERIDQLRERIEKFTDSAELANEKHRLGTYLREQTGTLYSPGCSNVIEHRVLTDLTPKERVSISATDARSAIFECARMFSSVYPKRFTNEDLHNSSTPIVSKFAPIYNFGMSVEQTLTGVRNYQLQTADRAPVKPFMDLQGAYMKNEEQMLALMKNAKELEACKEKLDPRMELSERATSSKKPKDKKLEMNLIQRFAGLVNDRNTELRQEFGSTIRRIWAPAEEEA